MTPIKAFPKFLVDNGLVFEINRKVLHPLGLALIIDVDHRNRKNLIVHSLVETDDPVGFVYDQEGFQVGAEKYAKYLGKAGQKRLDARLEKYGFVEQDKDDV